MVLTADVNYGLQTFIALCSRHVRNFRCMRRAVCLKMNYENINPTLRIALFSSLRFEDSSHEDRDMD